MRFDAISRFCAAGNRPADQRAIAGATVALLEQYGYAEPEPGNEYRGSTVLGIAEKFASKVGWNSERGMGNLFNISASSTTSDLPIVLAAVVSHVMEAAYEAETGGWQAIAAVTNPANFRDQARVRIGGFDGLDVVPEGQAYNNTTMFAASSDDLAVQTRGRVLKMTRELFINGRMDVLVEGARHVGLAAARSVSKAVFGMLAANPALRDGGLLFNSTAVSTAGGHANAPATGTDLEAASLAISKAAMRNQVGLPGGEPLNIRARTLVVPASLEDAAWALAGAPMGLGEPGSAQERELMAAGRLRVVSDPYLDAANIKGWYLAADPLVAPVLEIGFLGGVRTPYVDQGISFRGDALQMKARFDFGVAPADYRGGYFNPGAPA